MGRFSFSPEVDWNEANIATLKRMWADGKSYTEIQPHIPNASRSAIAGKIVRLKLPTRREQSWPDRAQRTARPRPEPAAVTAMQPHVSRPQNGGLSAVNAVRRVERMERAPGLAEHLEEPAVGKGLQMIELTDRTCRWPFGDPLTENFYFCGEPGADLQEKRPYCPFHSRKSVDRIRGSRAFESGALFAAGIKTSTRGAQHGT